ncbi:MAG: response regulator [Nitriliruptor sp.]|uniref:response regulator transcription factor n=1 Tax=Nitriliruptor sp. TaxID=2448056 RepID=UPI00349FF948
MSEPTPDPVRVVVVDDEPGIRRILELTLRRSGRYEVVAEAGDGEGALEAIAEHTPDVVLLDLMLGPEWGVDLIAPVLARSPGTMVAILTALSAEREEDAALSAGAFVYYEKTMVVNLVEYLDRDHALFRRALDGDDVLAPSALQRRYAGVPSGDRDASS